MFANRADHVENTWRDRHFFFHTILRSTFSVIAPARGVAASWRTVADLGQHLSSKSCHTHCYSHSGPKRRISHPFSTRNAADSPAAAIPCSVNHHPGSPPRSLPGAILKTRNSGVDKSCRTIAPGETTPECVASATPAPKGFALIPPHVRGLPCRHSVVARYRALVWWPRGGKAEEPGPPPCPPKCIPAQKKAASREAAFHGKAPPATRAGSGYSRGVLGT